MSTAKLRPILSLFLLFILLFMVGCAEENDNLSKSEIRVTAQRGEVSLTPDKNVYQIGEEVTLEANPESGYEFTGWVINGEVKKNKTTRIKVDQPIIQVEASFSELSNPNNPDDSDQSGKIYYTVDTEIANDSTDVGAVAIINGETNSEINSGDQIEAGTMVQVEANPKADNYKLTHWEINGRVVNAQNNNPYVIDSLNQNFTIRAYFDDKVSIEAESTGIISGITITAYDLLGNELGVLYQDSAASELEVDAGQEIILTTSTKSSSYGLHAWRINGNKRYEQVLTEIENQQGIKVTVNQNLTDDNSVEAIYSPIVYNGSYQSDQGTVLGAIRESKEKGKIYGPLTEKDLAEVTYLNATGYDISDLDTIVEYLDNLSTLILRRTDSDEEDLETISRLTSLEELNLNNPDANMDIQDIGSISKLEKLTELRILKVRYNKIEDVDFIQNMKKLEVLDLLGNNIKIVDPITNLDNLEVVNLLSNKAILMTESADESVPDTNPVPQTSLEYTTGLKYSDSNFDDVGIWQEHIEDIASGNNIDLHENISATVYANIYPRVTKSIRGDGEGQIMLSPSPASGKYYYPGAQVTVTVSSGANSTYVDKSLEVNGSGIEAGDTITIPYGDVVITAEFKRN